MFPRIRFFFANSDDILTLCACALVHQNRHSPFLALLAQAFYNALPQYKSNPLYIFGESYAGHYVPAIAHRLWVAAQRKEGFPVPLKGIGIGNGLVDPEVQYRWYPNMAQDGGKSEGGTLEKGVITPRPRPSPPKKMVRYRRFFGAFFLGRGFHHLGVFRWNPTSLPKGSEHL